MRLPSQKDVCGPITSKTPGKVYHGHGGHADANVINNTFLYTYLSFMISDTCATPILGIHILGLSFTCTHHLETQCASSAAMNNTFFLYVSVPMI